MKLLFDENLSHKLVGSLAHEFPGCDHVRDISLRGAEDQQIWDHARTQGLVIVSKDTDFRERSYLEGFPPKIIWLDVGNAGTVEIAELLRRERQRIERFDEQQEASLLISINRADCDLASTSVRPPDEGLDLPQPGGDLVPTGER